MDEHEEVRAEEVLALTSIYQQDVFEMIPGGKLEQARIQARPQLQEPIQLVGLSKGAIDFCFYYSCVLSTVFSYSEPYPQ